MPILSPTLTKRPVAAMRPTRLLPFSPQPLILEWKTTAAMASISVFPARRGGLRLRIWHHHVLHLLSELPKTGCHDPEREGSDGRNDVVPN
ncbi:hypothetical protein PVAP13_1KG395205 [Panicum virgatum]|uniref:Uncharacterized protein n=1 Tax=Panicum virgatum TaxID=38727 RepID=A0A8T0XSF6_PANVG|nr:hypothetical protein PVAP13_1KG395205 [Panicum virgatum]